MLNLFKFWRRSVLAVAWAVIILLAAQLPVFAQGLTGVTGKVTDPSGAVIPGVEVTITNAATGAARTVLTNDTGTYTASQLQPGTYNVKAELAGFRPKAVNNVPLPVNETVTLNLPLEVGAVSDVVDVIASAEVLNTVNAQLGVGFDQKKIIDLPLNARNIVDLLGLQSGVTVSQKVRQGDGSERDDGGQVNGARNDQQNIVLDGVDVNAQERGSSFQGALPTTLDSVQEFIVQTAGQSGSAGRSSGAQVQLVTRSGSNAWHGSAYEFYRTTGTSARGYFAPEASPLIRHLPGGSLGGPVLKDKVFLFGAYERRTDRSATLVTKDVPTPQFLSGIVRYQKKDGSFGTITDGCGGLLEKISLISCDTWNRNLIGGAYERFRPFSTDATRTKPGNDNGANALKYRFNAPFRKDQNIYISRIDYNLNANNTLFARGTLNDDVRTLSAETFPGFNNARERLDNSKGFAASWNSVISASLNSNFSAGLTRESTEDTGNSQPYFNAQLFSNFVQTTGASRQAIDTWNFVENLSWIKGSHHFQGGVNFRYLNNSLSSFDAVRPSVYSGGANLSANGIGGASNPALRRALGDEEFARVADPGIVGDALLNATGSITLFSEDVQFDIRGNRMPGGRPLVRNIRLREYDFYLQDTWKARNDLTLTYGAHYGIVTPPYERDGVQVNWAEHLGQRLREQRDTTKTAAQLPLYTAQPAGRANNLPDYYTTDTNNWAPRVSVAWTPGMEDGLLGFIAKKGGQMVIRGGYALTYDHTGGRFARDAALTGSVGLLTRFATPSFSRSLDGLNQPRAPRVGVGGGLPRSEFPQLTQSSFALVSSTGGWGGVSSTGIDSGLHSPSNNLLNLTISKELPGGWVVEASYVGRFARQLLGQVDLASPVNIRDSSSGMTYYQAMKQLYENYELKGAPVSAVQPIAWFENVYGDVKGYAERQMKQSFGSATQAFYALLNRGITPGANAQANISDQINFFERDTKTIILAQPQVQFFGLFSNVGRSNYNSGQFTLRKRYSQGYTFTLNYTISKSLDITSQAEARGNRPNGATGEGLAEDPYNPEFSYAISDFDRRHQFNGNFLAELPFGRDKLVGSNAPAALNHIIGGWEVSGIVVATSGRPWNFTSSNRFNHHFFGRMIPHLANPDAVDWGLEKQNGRVFLIGGGATARNTLARSGFVSSYPGSAIARNQGRGPRFFNMDTSLGKTIQITEGVSAKLRWETFNAMNHPNFDIPNTSNGLNIDRFGGGLGEVLQTQGTERVMQFSLRLVF